MTNDPCGTKTGPLTNVDPPIHILMALQGGGALAAFEAGVLAHFHDGLGVGDQIRAVSGVSFGGITAAIYVANFRKDPIQALKKFWNAVTFADSPLYPRVLPFVKDTPLEEYFYDVSLPAQLLSFFLNPNVYRTRLDTLNAANWIYLWDNSPLRSLLSKLIDEDELNSRENPQLILTTANIETGELVIFNNREQRLTIDNVLASASLPPVFKPTEIDRERYWDGALFDNSPFLARARLVHPRIREGKHRPPGSSCGGDQPDQGRPGPAPSVASPVHSLHHTESTNRLYFLPVPRGVATNRLGVGQPPAPGLRQLPRYRRDQCPRGP
jgi:predicted acylesterase/phospholipase RssA